MKQKKLSLQYDDDGIYKREGDSAFDVASSIVGASVVVRKNEQSVNLGSILTALIFFIAIPYWWLNAIGARIQRAEDRKLQRATTVYELRYGTSTPIVILSVEDAMRIAQETMVPTVTASPLPTVTALPSPTGTGIYTVNAVFKYSYYNPKLGGANCFQWDASVGDCMSMMANGEDWRSQYGKAVACPPGIALGTVVEVTYPDALAGFWTCKDRGGAIVDTWIDFLDISQRAEWGSQVSATLYPPTIPVEEITKGSH